MEDELVVNPLQRALQLRQPAVGLITHSDRVGQYVSAELKELIRLWHIRPSMSRAEDPYDNRTDEPAFAESFWIGPPKRPPEGGGTRRGSIFECGGCTNRNFRLH